MAVNWFQIENKCLHIGTSLSCTIFFNPTFGRISDQKKKKKNKPGKEPDRMKMVFPFWKYFSPQNNNSHTKCHVSDADSDSSLGLSKKTWLSRINTTSGGSELGFPTNLKLSYQIPGFSLIISPAAIPVPSERETA